MRTLRCRNLTNGVFMQFGFKLLLGAVALIAVLLMFGKDGSGSGGGSSEKATARRAIDLCWEDQRRKSLPPDQARFIAGACEKMESNFRQRFGHSP